MEKRRRVPDDHWPWVVKAFTPRHQNYPVFKTATVSGERRKHAAGFADFHQPKARGVMHRPRRRKRDSPRKGSVEVSQSGGLYGPAKLATPMMVLEASGGEGEKPTSSSGRSYIFVTRRFVRPGDSSGGHRVQDSSSGRCECVEEQAGRHGAGAVARAGFREFARGAAGGYTV